MNLAIWESGHKPTDLQSVGLLVSSATFVAFGTIASLVEPVATGCR